MNAVLRFAPLGLFGVLILGFGALSPRFLSLENLSAILVQSSWLIAVALGMNFALLAAGVDLSVGAAMYVTACVVGLGLSHASVWVCLVASIVTGALFGSINASLIVALGLPAFIVTLATTFIGRGIGLLLSSTRIVYASSPVADFGRTTLLNVPVPSWIAVGATALAWIVLNRTPFGPYVRSIGADRKGARRVGVSVSRVTWGVYVLCGAFAGLGGFISLSQTSAASAAFGQNAEFLAIAAVVLGGTSLFGGRGTVWAPAIGAVLIMTVQNGLVLIDANPYAYPVITGAVIFIAALLDSIRTRSQARLARRAVRIETRPSSRSRRSDRLPDATVES